MVLQVIAGGVLVHHAGNDAAAEMRECPGFSGPDQNFKGTGTSGHEAKR
jgi:hypothetical protein